MSLIGSLHGSIYVPEGATIVQPHGANAVPKLEKIRPFFKKWFQIHIPNADPGGKLNGDPDLKRLLIYTIFKPP